MPAEFGKPGLFYHHSGAATQVAFAAENSSFYSASLDRTIKIWKLASDVPIRSFQHGNRVGGVAINPAGTQLATACADGMVRIWDLAKGQQLKQIEAHTKPIPSPVYCVTWTSDGKQVISGSLDQSLKLWDAGSGALVREFKAFKTKDFEKGHRDGVFCVALSADGKLVASGSSDRTIKIWNVADGTVLRECINLRLRPAAKAALPSPASHPGYVYSICFTPDTRRLVSAGNAPRHHGYLALWNVADGSLIHGAAYPLGPIYAVAVSPDGKRLALGCGPRSQNFDEVDCHIMKMPEPSTE
jgi:WD40 repeat protein